MYLQQISALKDKENSNILRQNVQPYVRRDETMLVSQREEVTIFR